MKSKTLDRSTYGHKSHSQVFTNNPAAHKLLSHKDFLNLLHAFSP